MDVGKLNWTLNICLWTLDAILDISISHVLLIFLHKNILVRIINGAFLFTFSYTQYNYQEKKMKKCSFIDEKTQFNFFKWLRIGHI